MTLSKIRKQIDEIDSLIVNLLSERIKLGETIKDEKKVVEDKKREKEVLEHVRLLSESLDIPSKDLLEFYEGYVIHNTKKKQL